MLTSDWAWRIPSLLQMLASVVQIACVYLCPESPRWLVENDRIDEATRVLVKYHANGDENDPIVELELAEIQEAIAVDRQINATTSYLTLFKTPANRRRTGVIIAIGFFSQWSGNGLISYYLSVILTSIGYTDSKQQLMINGIIQAFSLVTSVVLAMFIVNRFKRRTLWLTSTIGLLVCFVIWTGCEATYEISAAKGNPNVAAGKAVLAVSSSSHAASQTQLLFPL
jgi:MFS family permease